MEKAMQIAIVGGGATGILVATHLARRLDAADDEVVMIEPGETLGRGLAYATDDPRHLLNVRVAKMSAFAGEPNHLVAWLSARCGAGAANGSRSSRAASMATTSPTSPDRRCPMDASGAYVRFVSTSKKRPTTCGSRSRPVKRCRRTSRSSPPATTPSRRSTAFRPNSRGAPARSKVSRPTRRSSSSARA